MARSLACSFLKLIFEGNSKNYPKSIKCIYNKNIYIFRISLKTNFYF